MNDGQFPRLQRRLGFDLMAGAPRPGDRSARDEDRYLFLEALLSARERLIVTYVGRSVQDNSVIPPSVVLGELLEVFTDSFHAAANDEPQASLDLGLPGQTVIEQVRVDHPLQSFSPRYFLPGGGGEAAASDLLFSYDLAAADGAAQLAKQTHARPRFVQRALPEPDLESPVALAHLAAFVENPARWLLRGRLGLSLEDRSEVLEDREPLELDALDRWVLGSTLLEQALTVGEAGDAAFEGDQLERLWAAVQARGLLPAGTPGRCIFDDVVPDVKTLAAYIRWHAEGERREPAAVEFTVDGTVVQGQLRELWPGAQIRSSFSRVQPKHELVAWVEHLALQCVADELDLPRTTVIVGRDRDGGAARHWVLAALDAGEARLHLAQLVRLYRLGQRVPLPFFPATSRRFVEDRAAQLAKRPDDVAQAERHALRAAREVYAPADFGHLRGEAEDPYVARIFGDRDPLGLDPYEPFDEPLPEELAVPCFADLARLVFEPLLASLEAPQ